MAEVTLVTKKFEEAGKTRKPTLVAKNQKKQRD